MLQNLCIPAEYLCENFKPWFHWIRACVPDEEIASLAATDFHSSQTVYQEELQYLERLGPFVLFLYLNPEKSILFICTVKLMFSTFIPINSWVKEFKLEELEFARIMPLICLYPPAATLFPCELYEARMAMSKHNILLTVVDDLFDVGGSREEMENLVKLIEMCCNHPSSEHTLIHTYTQTNC